MKLFDIIAKWIVKTIGNDSATATQTQVGFVDVVVRELLMQIKVDLAIDCDLLELYCQDPMYLRILPQVRHKLLQDLRSNREELQQLIKGLHSGTGFKIYDEAAPDGAYKIGGIDVPVYSVIKKQTPKPTKLILLSQDDEVLFEMIPPTDAEEESCCLIGRNTPHSRHNDIDIQNGVVSRNHATIIWRNSRWEICSSCSHTWLNRSYLDALMAKPLTKMQGKIFLDNPSYSDSPYIKYRQEQL